MVKTGGGIGEMVVIVEFGVRRFGVQGGEGWRFYRKIVEIVGGLGREWLEGRLGGGGGGWREVWPSVTLRVLFWQENVLFSRKIVEIMGVFEGGLVGEEGLRFYVNAKLK